MSGQVIEICQTTTLILLITFIIFNWFQKKRAKICSKSPAQILLPSIASNECINRKLYNKAVFSRYLNPIDMFENVLSSQNRDLCTHDVMHAERIYDYIKDIIVHKSIPVDFFEFEQISNVMIRCHKLIIMNDNDHFEIRFNIFLNCAETFIHNHQAHFISICISGGFVHDIFACDNESIDCVYHKYSRIDANTVQYKGTKHGKIQHVQRSVHQKNNNYFLDRDTLHTVCTPDSRLYGELKYYDSCHDIDANTKSNILQDAAITFVVRSKLRRPNKTTIISNDFVDPKSTACAGGKTHLSHSHKIKTIKLLFQSMNS